MELSNKDQYPRRLQFSRLKYCLVYSLFFCLVGRKYHLRSRRPIANVVFSASLDKKIVY